jgi:Domain of unknown function (DUF3331)
MLAKCDAAWVQTIGLLDPLSGAREAVVGRKRAAAARGERGTPASIRDRELPEGCVSILERPSASTVTIAWRDATTCCYADQIWHASLSRSQGVCAMSGRPILPGDAVYRPRARRPLPLNVDAMILAVVVHDALRCGNRAP